MRSGHVRTMLVISTQWNNHMFGHVFQLYYGLPKKLHALSRCSSKWGGNKTHTTSWWHYIMGHIVTNTELWVWPKIEYVANNCNFHYFHYKDMMDHGNFEPKLTKSKLILYTYILSYICIYIHKFIFLDRGRFDINPSWQCTLSRSFTSILLRGETWERLALESVFEDDGNHFHGVFHHPLLFAAQNTENSCVVQNPPRTQLAIALSHGQIWKINGGA